MKVRKRNAAKKMYLKAFEDEDIDEKKMMDWLSKKAPEVRGWKPEEMQRTFSQFSDSEIEFAGTTPPTRICHVIKLRFLHKKKKLALEHVAISKDGVESERTPWFVAPMCVANEKPDESVITKAIKVTDQVFSEYKLLEKEREEKGWVLGMKSKKIVPTLRSTERVSKHVFKPHELRGVNTVCSIHYVDVSIDGLPGPPVKSKYRKKARKGKSGGERRDSVEVDGEDLEAPDGDSTFSTRHYANSGLFENTHLVRWQWSTLSSVEDVRIVYDSLLDQVRRLKGKLGNRTLTCEQARELALLIPVSPDEYAVSFNDAVKTRKGPEDAWQFGRVVSAAAANAGGMYSVEYFGGGGKDPWVEKVPLNLITDTQPHPREDIVVACFSRVMDVENFDRVMDTLEPHAEMNVVNRLGCLNVMNATRLERYFKLDLRVHDEWVMANCLAKLALVEEGVNFRCPGGKGLNDHIGVNFCGKREACQCHFYRDEKKYRENLHNLAWGVPMTWDDQKFLPDCAAFSRGTYKRSPKPKENAVPREGRLVVKYASDDVNEELRKLLNSEYMLVGVEQRRNVDKFSRIVSFRSQGLLLE